MNRTRGRGSNERRGTGHDDRQRTAEREAGEHASQTGYRPSVNQRRDEPMPASHHDDLRQETAAGTGGHAGDDGQAQPSPRAPSRRAERRGRG